MKKLLLILAIGITGLSVQAQKQITPAASGVTYGAGASVENAIPANQLEKSLVKGKFEGKIKGTVVEVCKEKGCWMKMENSNGDQIMVKFKDYGYFMPTDISGKNVVLDGEATIKEVSVKDLKHFAEDAGKTQEEIDQITKSKKEIIFVAKGVLVL